ncbi:hypothetical protein FRB94_005836 [Tulasnella sp. JGI-2019a]|nr:hypothetical protein FRB93_011454 [Tulasnella sp. JGI-2019a]KAG9012519.1 hypothetical protein FRB94_005836 [Tulasnella sp. JGI-2019a]
MNSLYKASIRCVRSRLSLSTPKTPYKRSFSGAQPTGSGTQSSSQRIGLLALGGLAVGTSYTLGSIYPPTLAELAFPRPAPSAPHRESLEGIELMQHVEEDLQNLSIVQSLRSKKQDYYETRPYLTYPEEKRIHSFTAGTLRGPGMFAVPPLVFGRWDDSESVVIIHAGRSLCGHDGIVHGGLLATLLDEALARTAIMTLPSKIAVTANLNVNYKAPTKADQFIIIRTWLEEVNGRKIRVRGHIEDVNGQLLVEASSLFVEPKYAAMLQTAAGETIGNAIGAKPLKPTQGHPLPGIDVAITS